MLAALYVVTIFFIRLAIPVGLIVLLGEMLSKRHSGMIAG